MFDRGTQKPGLVGPLYVVGRGPWLVERTAFGQGMEGCLCSEAVPSAWAVPPLPDFSCPPVPISRILISVVLCPQGQTFSNLPTLA